MFVAIAFVAGLVFGTGLLFSGMADPAKVLGFLDIAGHWDPSLAMVMAGAVAVAAPGFALTRRHAKSLLGVPIQWPPKRGIDRRLVIGSTLFGAGWGLAGFCPGPALVALGLGEGKALVFVCAMLAGMGLFELIEKRRRSRRSGR